MDSGGDDGGADSPGPGTMSNLDAEADDDRFDLSSSPLDHHAHLGAKYKRKSSVSSDDPMTSATVPLKKKPTLSRGSDDPFDAIDSPAPSTAGSFYSNLDEDHPPVPEVAQWVDEFQHHQEPFQTLPGNIQLDALAALISSCSISHIRHLKQNIEPYFQKDFISLLPKEVSLYILSMLAPSDLARTAQTCRYWRTITEDHRMWREKCQEAGVVDLQPSPNPPGPCYQRCPWKAKYLRHRRLQYNWRMCGGPLRNQTVFKGHDEHVITCLRLSGDLIVSGSDDNTLRVWSASRGELLHTYTGHSGGVWSSQLSLDGRLVISGSTDRTVRVWCTQTGECLHVLNGHTSTVRCMSLRENILVTGSRDTTLRAWNVRSGVCVRVLSGHAAAIRCVQFDGKRIVSGAYDYLVKVWDFDTGACVHTLSGHTNRVYSLLFDSAKNLVISGSLDTSIRVWDIVRGECLQTLVGHQSLTSGMAMRDHILVSGNADATVKVWNVRDGQCIHTLSGLNRHKSAVTSLVFLHSDMVVTSSDDGTVKLWDAKQGVFIRNLVELPSGGQGGCIWRLKATPTSLVCAVGSRNGTEDTKLIMLNFDANYP